MARKKHSGGRTTPKGTRPAGWQPKQRHGSSGRPPFVAEAEMCVRERSPLPLLLMASKMIEAVEAEREPGEEMLDESAVFMSFATSGYPELAALSLAVAELHPDDEFAEALAALAGPEAAAVRAPWLPTMGEITVTGATLLTEPLGDGEQLTVSWKWPGGQPGTMCVFVDHNAGPMLRECFVAPIDIEQVRADLATPEGDDLELIDIDLAAAKTRIVEAVMRSEAFDPPLETETWPIVRPLLEWILGFLPDGGPGYVRPEWSADDRVALVDEFVASTFGAIEGLTAHQVRALTTPLVTFGCDVGSGDPLRVSPVSVEIVLVGWFTTATADDPAIDDELRPRLADVLRAWTRFAHHRRGIDPRLTDEVLGSIDRWSG